MTVYLAVVLAVSCFIDNQTNSGSNTFLYVPSCSSTATAEIKAFDSWEDACREATDKRVWRMEFQPNGNRFIQPGYTLTAFRCEAEPKYRLVEGK